MARDVVVVTWSGRTPALEFVAADETPAFRLILFCYLGEYDPALAPAGAEILSHPCECKGDIFNLLTDYLAKDSETPDFVGVLDDDIELSVSQINSMLRRAREIGATSFAATLTADSYASHPRFRSRPDSAWHEEPWVEVMAPFHDWRILASVRQLTEGLVSSHGFDQFAYAAAQKTKVGGRTILFDDTAMRHNRPVTSDARVFRNGMTARQERDLVRRRTMDWVRIEAPQLEGSPWWYAIFAPWNGPGSYWLERLACPLRKLGLLR